MIKFTITFELPSRFVWPVLVLVLLWRRLRFGYAFRRIPLTQGRFAIVDPQDYQRLSKYKWRLCRTKGKNVLYAERSIRLPGGKYSRLLMHRQIMENLLLASSTQNSKLRTQNYHRYLSDGYVIDHINGSGLDNRRANLRLATVAQNAWNSKKRNPRSGYKGVWLAADKGLWRAAIVCHGRRIHLGYFKDKIAAARAYDDAARTYYNEFARLNFPEESITINRRFCGLRGNNSK